MTFRITRELFGVCLVALLLAAGVVSPAAAEPVMTLRLPAFPGTTFPNGSSIMLPEAGVEDLEIWLQDALAEIQVSTVRVQLNGTPMSTFLTINRLPRGVRVVVKMGLSVNADFAIRPGRENILTFSATDTSHVGYAGQFYATVSAATTAPRLADRAPVRPALREVTAPPQLFPPTVALQSEWPTKTADRVLTLTADVADREGLRRIIIEINSKPIEEIVLENELPVRKKNGFIARGKLPGTVSGNGRKIAIAIPITIDKRLSTIGVRAENLSGLTAYADRTIELTTAK